MYKYIIFLLVLFNTLCLHADEAPIKVIYNKNSFIYNYKEDMLRFLLDKSGCKYEMIPLGGSQVSSCQYKLLELGILTVRAMAYDKRISPKFDIIPFPLLRGLNGYRILLVRNETAEKLNKVETVDELKKFLFGQGEDWIDTVILRSAGYEVIDAGYNDLPKMLCHKRYELFPRGLTEATWDLERLRKKYSDLTLYRKIILYYKSGLFFHVNKKAKRLRAALELGYRRSREDGSFIKFFYTHKLLKHLANNLSLENSKFFAIEREELPRELRNIPPSCWITPDEVKKLKEFYLKYNK
jgi:hypothetical protein